MICSKIGSWVSAGGRLCNVRLISGCCDLPIVHAGLEDCFLRGNRCRGSSLAGLCRYGRLAFWRFIIGRGVVRRLMALSVGGATFVRCGDSSSTVTLESWGRITPIFPVRTTLEDVSDRFPSIHELADIRQYPDPDRDASRRHRSELRLHRAWRLLRREPCAIRPVARRPAPSIAQGSEPWGSSTVTTTGRSSASRNAPDAHCGGATKAPGYSASRRVNRPRQRRPVEGHTHGPGQRVAQRAGWTSRRAPRPLRQSRCSVVSSARSAQPYLENLARFPPRHRVESMIVDTRPRERSVAQIRRNFLASRRGTCPQTTCVTSSTISWLSPTTVSSLRPSQIKAFSPLISR
jgi:hypothetical protein